MLVEHMDFVLEQIGGLDDESAPPAEQWHRHSRFYTSLRDGAAALRKRLDEKMLGKAASAERAAQRGREKEQRDAAREAERLAKIEEREQEKLARAAARAEAKDNKRYPIDDGQLLEERAAAGVPEVPMPLARGTYGVTDGAAGARAPWLPPALVAPALGVWLTARQFGRQLGLAPFPLGSLVGALQPAGAVSAAHQLLLSELCAALTRVVARGREKRKRRMNVEGQPGVGGGGLGGGEDDMDDMDDMGDAALAGEAEGGGSLDAKPSDGLNDGVVLDLAPWGSERRHLRGAEWYRCLHGWREVGVATWQEAARLALAGREDGMLADDYVPVNAAVAPEGGAVGADGATFGLACAGEVAAAAASVPALKATAQYVAGRA